MNANSRNPQATRIRALFISDFHFGYKGVDAAAILNCLESYAPQKIYLVGDIIDGWKLTKRWYWTADYTRVLDALVDHRRRGAEIIYLPGNHDERVRQIDLIDRAKFSFKIGLRICNSLIHRTKDGKKIVVLHGDQFDNALMRGRLSKIGDWFYDFMTDIFDFIAPAPLVEVEGRKMRFSLAKTLVKRSGKMLYRILGTLERAIIRLVKRKMVYGLICGHTHIPKLKMLRRKYFYGNCGTWMGYVNTALIETMDGNIELVRWPDMRKANICIPASEAVHMARHYETAVIIRRIRQLWPSRKEPRDIAA